MLTVVTTTVVADIINEIANNRINYWLDVVAHGKHVLCGTHVWEFVLSHARKQSCTLRTEKADPRSTKVAP